MYVPYITWKMVTGDSRTRRKHILSLQFTKNLTKYLELRPETCPGEAYCQLWETNI